MSNRCLDDRGRKGLTNSQRDNKYDRSRTRSRSRSGSSRSRSSSYSSSSSRSRSRSKSRSKYRRDSKSKSKSRSTSPEQSKYNNLRSVYRKDHGSSSSSSAHPNRRHDDDKSHKDREQDLEQLAPPPPPIISKVSMQFGKPSGAAKPVQLKLGATKPNEIPKKITVASAFSNNDSDDEVEEMPAECRMRMRNIGRDTPTSSGPNSFGKTKQGFCDAKKIFEKNLRNMTYD